MATYQPRLGPHEIKCLTVLRRDCFVPGNDVMAIAWFDSPKNIIIFETEYLNDLEDIYYFRATLRFYLRLIEQNNKS